MTGSLRTPLFGLVCLALAFLLGHLAGGDAARLIRHAPLLGPDLDHPLGTNAIGQDIFWRMLVGGHYTLTVALPAALGALGIGTLLGLLAGYRRGVIDLLCLWLANAIDALPFYLWATVLVVALAPSPLAIPLAIGGVYWTRCFRLTRAEAVRLRETGYVQAAVLLGVGPIALAWRHLLPAIGYLVLAQGTLLIAAAIKVEVTVSFLGLSGADSVSWGTMLAEAAQDLTRGHPWNAIAAGGAIAAFLLLLTTLADRIHARYRERTDDDSAR